MKRDAVIKEAARPLFRKLMAITTGQSDLYVFCLSCSERSLKLLKTVKVGIVK